MFRHQQQRQSPVVLVLLLITLVLPAAHSRNSFLALSAPAPQPTRMCSPEELVNWLTLQDLGQLVARWAAKERVATVRVLHALENSLLTAPQVHQQQQQQQPSGFVQTAPRHSLPPPGPPISPMESMPSGPRGLPPLTLGPPAIPFPGPINRQMPPPVDRQLPPLETLMPPPDALVQIVGEMFDAPISPVSITVSPRMTVADAVRQAGAKQADGAGSGDAGLYRVAWGQNRHLHCYVAGALGDLSANNAYAWEFIISDAFAQEVYRGVCLPTLNEVQVRPGMTITLNYTKRELIAEV